MSATSKLITELGEKRIIREFIKPFFNSADDPAGVGDDCAMVAFGDEVALLSTDRIPSDLTAIRLGILDFCGIGDYLARLNLSDIAGCGGRAVGLLLNLGLPSDFRYEQVQDLCKGFRRCAERHGAMVLGGDITSACELSISATSIGRVPRTHVLSRRGAKPGDSVFISRPLGLTPAAFSIYLGGHTALVAPENLTVLQEQFTSMEPMLNLGQRLGAAGTCTACMDNTDGIGQSLSELGEASGFAIVIDMSAVVIHPVVQSVCAIMGERPEDLVFNGGADFSLVGTLRGKWTNDAASTAFGYPIEIIGSVEEGRGLWIDGPSGRTPLCFAGWNYFNAAGRSAT